VYKEMMLQFTMATLLFTLFINGLSIKWLLVKLGLHLKKKEEKIIEDENQIFELDHARQKLAGLDSRQFDTQLLKEIDTKLMKEEEKLKNALKKIATPEEFLLSLKSEALEVERRALRELYEDGRFSEGVYYTFDSELDVQQDTLEYPEVYPVRTVDEEGRIRTTNTFRKRLLRLRNFVSRYPLLGKLLNLSSTDLISERYSLLRARLFTSYAVLEYLERVEKIFGKNGKRKAIEEVRLIQNTYIKANKKEIKALEKQYPRISANYQRESIYSLIYPAKTH
jgi:hypothetical protein